MDVNDADLIRNLIPPFAFANGTWTAGGLGGVHINAGIDKYKRVLTETINNERLLPQTPWVLQPPETIVREYLLTVLCQLNNYRAEETELEHRGFPYKQFQCFFEWDFERPDSEETATLAVADKRESKTIPNFLAHFFRHAIQGPKELPWTKDLWQSLWLPTTNQQILASELLNRKPEKSHIFASVETSFLRGFQQGYVLFIGGMSTCIIWETAETYGSYYWDTSA